MPELPEVEVLVRHLAPRVSRKTINAVQVLDPHSLQDTAPARFRRALTRARIRSLQRRGKYLVFTLAIPPNRKTGLLVHLGMTGRLYLTSQCPTRCRHARIGFDLGGVHLVFADARRFGRMTLDGSALERLGPEPLEPGFTVKTMARALGASRQPIKCRLLDQSVVAGIGNIYASEALFHARIDPRTPSGELNADAIRGLRKSLRAVLSQAIRFGSTVPLQFDGASPGDTLFYYGLTPAAQGSYEERLRVYDREDAPCRRCGGRIRRIVQAGRSTFFCPGCQIRPVRS